MSKNVNKPDHYQSNGVKYLSPECIHITRNMNFNLGNAFKYIWRAGKKGDKCKEIEDACKALWYVNDYCHFFGETAECNKTAAIIFNMMNFSDDVTEKYRHDILHDIVFFNCKKVKSGIKNFISHLIWKDFQNASLEEIEKIKSMVGDKDFPEFTKSISKIN